MRFHTLSEWLAWQERLHPSAIDLGLERCAAVARRMGLAPATRPVVTVAGTNGKGSCVMLLEAALRAAGHHAGAYTSPHLHHYRERIRIDGVEADDAALVRAFSRIDQARADISLTFFEFGTLAALEIFRRAEVDVAVLEVGLGGRLDAVNVLDADFALISSIGVDHAEWLGGTRESVGREKAGVLRPGQPCVYAERDPPQSLLAHAGATGADLHRLGVHYDFAPTETGWSWWWADGSRRLDDLPRPALAGPRQLQNAAAVLALLHLARDRLVVPEAALREAMRSASLPGRVEVLPGEVTRVLDVAHNPQAAAVLAEYLAATPVAGRTLACVGMLEDKDVVGCARAMAGQVDTWFAGGIRGPRGQDGASLAARVAAVVEASVVSAHVDVASAYRAALAAARPGDRVVAFGSFVTVGAARDLERQPD